MSTAWLLAVAGLLGQGLGQVIWSLRFLTGYSLDHVFSKGPYDYDVLPWEAVFMGGCGKIGRCNLVSKRSLVTGPWNSEGFFFFLLFLAPLPSSEQFNFYHVSLP